MESPIDITNTGYFGFGTENVMGSKCGRCELVVDVGIGYPAGPLVTLPY